MHPTIAAQQALARRAQELSRRIDLSMPWRYRVADLLLVLAADSLDSFGRVIYSEFIRSGIRGMPNTEGGKAALDLIHDVERKGADALPPGYGRPFATKVFKILLSKFVDPEVAEDAMANVVLQAVRGKIHIRHGAALREAESYVITACLNGARDLLRARSRRREDPLVGEDDRDVDVTDSEAFRDLDKSIASRDMERILQDAARLTPKAREYLESVLRGDTQSDWARELGVTDAAVSKFVRKIREPLKQVLREHLRSAGSLPAYDYRT